MPAPEKNIVLYKAFMVTRKGTLKGLKAYGERARSPCLTYYVVVSIGYTLTQVLLSSKRKNGDPTQIKTGTETRDLRAESRKPKPGFPPLSIYMFGLLRLIVEKSVKIHDGVVASRHQQIGRRTCVDDFEISRSNIGFEFTDFLRPTALQTKNLCRSI